MSEMASPAATDRASGAHQRKLAAILCADVVGYSRLMGEDETATYDALQQLRRGIDPIIASHAGRIVSTAGDGLLADFGSIVDALSCAVAMQQAARDLNAASPPDRHLQLRIGVNLGDVIIADDNDLYGDGINIAARLQAIAAPGGICLSHTVYEQVKNKLALDYRPLGRHRVKNIAEPVRVYAVGATAPAAARLFARWRELIAVAVAGTAIVADLVDGSVRRAGDRLRITVKLTEAATGIHLWSDTYNAELKDIFAVQDQITERIVGLTAVNLTRLERERVSRKPTANLAAYEYVLRGRADLTNPTRSANHEAQTLFQRAIDLDPNYAAAYAALGFAHHEGVVSGWTEFPDDEIARAEALAKKAQALDPATIRAYLLLANIGLYRRDYDRALAQVDHALAINPSDVECYQMRGNILQWSGKATEALPWLEGALRLGSSSPVALVNI